MSVVPSLIGGGWCCAVVVQVPVPGCAGPVPVLWWSGGGGPVGEGMVCESFFSGGGAVAPGEGGGHSGGEGVELGGRGGPPPGRGRGGANAVRRACRRTVVRASTRDGEGGRDG